MFGLGTIINVTAIVAGGVMGLLFGKKLTERYQSNLMMASALCVLFIGVSGCMEQMLKLTENGLSSSGSMMMIVCFAVGALIGVRLAHGFSYGVCSTTIATVITSGWPVEMPPRIPPQWLVAGLPGVDPAPAGR